MATLILLLAGCTVHSFHSPPLVSPSIRFRNFVVLQSTAPTPPLLEFDNHNHKIPENHNHHHQKDSKNPTTENDNDHHNTPAILAGTSPKTLKLCQRLDQLRSTREDDRRPIVVTGVAESVASVVDHVVTQCLPPEQTHHVHRLDMQQAISYPRTILGDANDESRGSGSKGVLDLLANLANATLVVTNLDAHASLSSPEEFTARTELWEAVERLLSNQTFYSRFETREKTFAPRIVVSGAEKPDLVHESNSFLVKIPPLQARTQDMEAIASAKVRTMETKYNLANVVLGREALHRLLDHEWQGDEAELDQELEHALARLADDQRNRPDVPSVLQSKHILVETWEQSSHHRLLYEFPQLRQLIHSPWVFDHTLRYIVTRAFVLVLAALFLGPQTREENAALTVFWAGWWPAVMLSFPFLGRMWCSLCPFMAVGRLAQEAMTQLGVELKKAPKWVSEIGPTFAFSLFVVILLWEELWNLPQHAALSAWLLLLITSGAVFHSVQYEKRPWCRHLCPIGAMCRVFGTMSMLEVRSFKSNCQGCTQPLCLTGGGDGGMSPALDPTDQFAIKGCSMGIKNNQLRDMGQVRSLDGGEHEWSVIPGLAYNKSVCIGTMAPL